MAPFRGRFRLQEELEAAVPAFHKNEVRGYAVAQTPNIKRDELAYFALSVFWRASVQTWPSLTEGGKPIKIDLGETNNEALRRYLMKDSGAPTNLSMFFVACTDKASQGSFHMPNLGRKENFVWNYSFMACGYLFNLIPEASRLLRAAVRSSLKVNPQDPSEFRSDEADGMWKRLMESGIALFVRAGATTYVMKANVKRSATKSPDSPSLRLSPRP